MRKWKDAVYWTAAEVRMLMERAEVEGLELGAGEEVAQHIGIATIFPCLAKLVDSVNCKLSKLIETYP